MKPNEIIISERITDRVTATFPFDIKMFIGKVIELIEVEAGGDYIILREPPIIDVDEYGVDEIQVRIDYEEANIDFEEIISQVVKEMIPPEKPDETNVKSDEQ